MEMGSNRISPYISRLVRSHVLIKAEGSTRSTRYELIDKRLRFFIRKNGGRWLG